MSDEFVLAPVVRGFVADVQAVIASAPSPSAVWRHAYDEHTGHAEPFRSGYVNVECADDEAG